MASVKQKSSLHSGPQDSLKLDKSTDDQKWQMVSSNKGQRKGTTSRSEITDESSTISKTVKVSSTNSSEYFVLYTNAMCDAQYCF
jgi:hypothetical protein